MQPALKYSQDFSADGVDPRRSWMQQPNDLVALRRRARARGPSGRGERRIRSALADLPGTQAHDSVVLEPFDRGFSKFRQQFSRRCSRSRRWRRSCC